jgi:hypothetical protein
VAALTAPTSPRHVTSTKPDADEFLAGQDHIRGLDHGVGGLDGSHQTLRLYHAQRQAQHTHFVLRRFCTPDSRFNY